MGGRGGACGGGAANTKETQILRLKLARLETPSFANRMGLGRAQPPHWQTKCAHDRIPNTRML